MAETITVARPYAQAAFNYATEQQALREWSDMLALLATVAVDPDMARLIESPYLTETQLADLIVDICGDRLTVNGANFVRVLAANRRMELLPDIAALFEIERQEAEGTIKAELVSAYPATDEQQARIIEGLRRRLGKDVELSCSTDAGLLGGAIIRAGDLVIDGSVRGKLQRLGSALSR
jgi:F-type H+-transporting ATPase subunit delta